MMTLNQAIDKYLSHCERDGHGRPLLALDARAETAVAVLQTGGYDGFSVIDVEDIIALLYWFPSHNEGALAA